MMMGLSIMWRIYMKKLKRRFDVIIRGNLMNFIKSSISYTNRYFREYVLRHMLIVGIIFVVTGLIAFWGVSSLPAEDLKEIYASIGEVFAEKDVTNSDGTLSFWGIFFNNLRAGAIISVMGLIPFLFIPITGVVLNSVLLGAVLAIIGSFSDESVIMLFVKYILPHGIFELPALIIEGAIGSKICAVLCRKIFGKAKDERFVDHLKGCVGIFVIYIIPLLLIAAFIEAVVLSALYL